jgi:kinesin family member 6/9
MEIYNEAAYDLLDPARQAGPLEELPRVTILEDESGVCHTRGLSVYRANSEEEALNLVCHPHVFVHVSAVQRNTAS